jgi:thiol:disulfide interchange protein DsbC
MDWLNRFFFIPLVFLGLILGGWSSYPSSVWARKQISRPKTEAAKPLPQCPPKEKLQEGIQKTFPKLQFEIIQIDPSRMKGLCQVQLKIGAQNHLLYADAQGEFALAGNLHELKTGKNLTQEALQILNRLTSEELQQLESLTAFTLGQGKKVVYLVTDPQCPYCKQAESLLKKLVEKEDLMVRFLFFPLDSHKGAREQCISILCDNKGIEGFDSGYRSENQCPEGIKKVDSTITFIQKKGINSTPTFIFMDGIHLSGSLNEDSLLNRLGLGKPAAK